MEIKGSLACDGVEFPDGVSAVSSLPTGLAGYWKMDESSGLVLIDGVGGINGTLSGPRCIGATGGGIGPYASGAIPSNPVNLNTSQWTISAWYRFPDDYNPLTQNEHTLNFGSGAFGPGDPDIGWNVGWQNYDAVNHRVYIQHWGGAFFISVYIPDPSGVSPLGTWHNTASTFDGGTVRLYYDGVLVASQSGVVAKFGGTDGFTINAAFTGSTDEVALFNRALTPGEVAGIVARIDLASASVNGGLKVVANNQRSGKALIFDSEGFGTCQDPAQSLDRVSVSLSGEIITAGGHVVYSGL